MRLTAWFSRERAIVLASLGCTTLLAWLYLFGMARDMADRGDMPGMAMGMAPPAGSFVVAATMWAVMMLGMMLPGAAPMILLYATVQTKQGRRPLLMTGLFLIGYLLVWGGFAVAAAGLQGLLSRAALLSPALVLTSTRLTGASFLVAAIYEVTPLKNRCLRQCRAPFAFIVRHWAPGASGAVRMGILHGTFCLGCCWMLMLLLFAAGVMNLAWVAALSALVLLQKLLPDARPVSALAGVGMLVVGVVLLLR